MAIEPEIERYYAENKKEPGRLDRYPLEKMRTQGIISRYLPNVPCKILDVGGASGTYAFWLSSLGHEVHLIDPVSYHIEEAGERAREAAYPPAVIAQGEAGHLEYGDESFDIVLMLGPLYHMQEYPDRITALKEAKRVVKKNGIIFSAFISRFAAIVDFFYKDLIKQPAFLPVMCTTTNTGRHSNPTAEPGWFTTAYFHHPNEISREIEASDLVCEKVLAIESFASYIPEIDARLKNPKYQRTLLDSITMVEEDQSLIGISNHILGIGRRPK